MTSRQPKAHNEANKAAAGLTAQVNPYVFALGMVAAALSTMALVLALIVGVTPLIWTQGSSSSSVESAYDSTLGLGSALPIPCHSHNDYWRRMPFYSAIKVGCIGIEADVWVVQGELLVGHNLGSLSSGQTLTSMYIQPLVELLQTKNSVNDPNIPFRGVYDHDPSQTLVLLVDLKADPNSSWPLLLERLEPLRQRGWLSHVNNGAFISRPVTVVGTGDTEVRLVNEETPFRDVFFDAPLNELEEGKYSFLNSYYTSVSFEKSIGKIGRGGLQPEQLAKLRNQISQAHSRGLKTRYWGMPYWPLNVRDQLRELLIDEGVDVLNADDLMEARDIFAKRGHLVK
ncbi:hypothetical protein CDV31_011149 [Fusarium ambrosium]|uniref:Altered inheritance of mitochondria protein 6 n=1 Tax=Fusarium ambrosium TaxID=131363 RepID=A0A428TIM6_9HYPO|nr:hypothetical protein CDV31_011149 [Fusarium ambrosium]